MKHFLTCANWIYMLIYMQDNRCHIGVLYNLVFLYQVVLMGNPGWSLPSDITYV
jgi:hypothetical protein